MRLYDVGWKGVCLAAALVLLAACESTPEASGDASDKGQQAQSSVKTTSSAPAPVATQGPAPDSQEYVDLNIGSMIYFDFDKSDLKPEARETIERWASWMKENPSVTITVEGNADERGTREYNLGLGERRATSARNYLIALGVNPDRVGTISYGKERPLCAASNEACWSQNRRDHLLVN